jgi:serine/threonine protein kinase
MTRRKKSRGDNSEKQISSASSKPIETPAPASQGTGDVPTKPDQTSENILQRDTKLETVDYRSLEGSVNNRDLSPSEDPATKQESLPRIPKYEMIDVIGRGGMGVVYKARQVGLERFVGIKMIHGYQPIAPQALRRFQVEAQALAKLHHPHVVHIYEVGDYGGQPYLVMEFVNGGSLRAFINKKSQDPRLAAEIVEKLARAMHAVHKQGIIHRDLKPDNILLAKSEDDGPWNTSIGCPKITDFGLVKLISQDEHRTVDGQLLGTAGYMAPEQARGDTNSIGVATDVYGLGAILYEILTGHPPFQGDNTLSILEKVRSTPVERISKYLPQLPKELESICLKCLAKEPEKRYPSALALAEELRQFILSPQASNGVITDGKKETSQTASRQFPQHFPAVKNLSIISFCAVTAGLLIYLGWYFSSSSSKTQTRASNQLANPHASPAAIVGNPPITGVLFSYCDPAALNSPLNVYNVKFAEELQAWCQAEKSSNLRNYVALENDWRTESHSADYWLKWLIKKGHESNSKTLLFFLGMPGHSDPERGPFVWAVPPVAKSPLPEHKLYVRDLLQRMKDGLNADQKKILVCDCSQEPSSWLHGMVQNDFAQGLKALEKEIKDVPNCVVICSCSPGQRSWVSPERGTSIFAHYFMDALHGGPRQKREQLIITLKEVNDHLQEWVNKWSLANRGFAQQPMILPGLDPKVLETFELTKADSAESPAKFERREKLADLKRPWREYYDLSQQTPTPEEIAPHKWRQYTDLLLRYEQVVWAGQDPTPIKQRLSALASELRQTGSPLISNDLLTQDRFAPLLSVLISQNPKLEEAAKLFGECWRSDNAAMTAEVGKKWDAFVLQVQDQPELRRQVAVLGWRWVIGQFQKEPSATVADALLQKLEASFRQSTRPADVHLLRMIVRDNREGPWVRVLEQKDLLRQVLALRRKAEQIAWKGIENADANAAMRMVHVYPWIRERIEKADQLRRHAEDLLFDAHEESWDQGKKDIKEANQLYDQAQDQARVIQDELRLRNQAFEQLRYFSRWAASCRDNPSTRLSAQVLTDLVEVSWTQAHELSAHLQQAETFVNPLAITDSLKKNIRAIDETLKEQINAFRISSAAAQPATWQALESLIQTPFFLGSADGAQAGEKIQDTLNQRMAILQKLKETSFELSQKWQQPANITSAAPAMYFSADRVARNLRLDLASLGKGVSSDVKKAQVLTGPSVSLGSTATQNPEDVARAADYLGRTWAALPAVIASQQHEEAVAAQEVLGNAGALPSLKQAQHWFAKTAQLVRQLDSGTAEPTHPIASISYAQVDALFRTHRFLLWQADRALADGWADVAVGTEDYALRTARAHLKSAAEILHSLTKEDNPSAPKKGWYAAVDDVQGRLALPKLSMKLEGLSARGQLDVTDEEFIKLGYHIGQKDLPGVPVVRIWSDSKSSSGAANFLTLRHESVKNDDHHFSQPATTLSRKLEWKNPSESLPRPGGPAQLRSMLLSRGHYFQNETIPVNFITTPMLRWSRTPPEGKAGMVVFGEDNAVDGHIHVLFDVTASMAETVQGGNATKIEIARESLAQDILKKIPKGIRLSISLFCAQSRERPTFSPSSSHCTSLVFGPRIWNPQTDIPEVMKEIPDVAKLKTMTGNQTPILNALRETLSTGPANAALGINPNAHLTLLMLTDGVENIEARETHCGAAIRDLLLRPENEKVEFHMLLFALSTEDLKEQYNRDKKAEIDLLNEDATKQLFLQKNHVPPRLWDNINSVVKLTNTLNEALRPRVTVYRDGRPLPANLRVKWDQEANWDPFLFPETGAYVVRTTFIRQPLRVETGDRLALKIEHGSRGNMLTKPSIADIQPRIDSRFRKQQNGVQLLLLQQGTESPIGGGHYLETQVALEKPIVTTTRDDELQQGRPPLAWFTLRPIGDAAAKMPLIVSDIPGELAPMWRLRAPNWPAGGPGRNPVESPANYRLEAFWVGGARAATSVALPRFRDIAPGQSTLPTALNLQLEELSIRKNAKGRDCLYVRCRHPHDQPPLLQLRSSDLFSGLTDRSIQEEHRYYSEADSVSAWFDVTSLLERDRAFTLDAYQLGPLLKNNEDTVRIDYESTDAGSKFDWLKSRRWPGN